MGRKRLENAKRNTIAVRFDDEEIGNISKAAELDHGQNAQLSPWIRDVAINEARAKIGPKKSRTGK